MQTHTRRLLPLRLWTLVGLAAGILLIAPGSSAQVTITPGYVLFSAPGVTAEFKVTVATSTTLGSISVLAMGAPTSEFTAVASGTTCPALVAGACKVTVLFQPVAPGRRLGALVFSDPDGNVLLNASLGGIGLEAMIAFSPGIVSTLAGGGTGGDGGQAINAALSGPTGIASDGFGNHFVADPKANVIRKITPAGIISTFAGTGSPGFSGNGGLAASARLSGPMAVLVDGVGYVYIADTGNNVVRKVDLAGVISTYAGQYYAPGTAPPAVCAKATSIVGDGCPGDQMVLSEPVELVWCHTQNLHIADKGHNRVRTVMRMTYNTITQVGTGAAGYDGDGQLATKTALNGPAGMFMDAANYIYIADTGNHIVRKTFLAGTNPSAMYTVAGTAGSAGHSGDGALAVNATLNSPYGVQVDPAGNIYVSELGSHVVRQVNVVTGLITTHAGTATAGHTGDGLPAASAQLNGPAGLLLEDNGDLLIVEQQSATIRKVNVSSAPTLVLANAVAGSSSAPQTVSVANVGTAILLISSVNASANFSLDGEGTSCTYPGNQSRPPGTACTLDVSFSPADAGALTGSVVLVDNARTGTQSIALGGTAAPKPESYGLSLATPSVSLVPGGHATATIALSSTTYAGTVTFTTTVAALDGAPATLTASTTSVALTAGGTGVATVTIASEASAAGRGPASPMSGSAALFIAGLLGAPFALRRKHLKLLLPLGLLLAASAALVACGGTGTARMYLVTVTPTGNVIPATSAVVSNPPAATIQVTVQ